MNESRICIALDFKTKSDVENFLKQFEGFMEKELKSLK